MSQDKTDKPATLTIDGREVTVPAGSTVLEAARQVGIDIPVLCYHPAAGGAGTCRVCVVQVVADGKERMVAACVAPAREGLAVHTDNENVQSARREVLAGLLAKAPAAKAVQELAAKYGVSEPASGSGDPQALCILCGQCVRACKRLIKVGALSFVGKGPQRKVGTPDGGQSEICIGCGVCLNVCPTGNVRIRDEAASRHMLTWNTKLPRSSCSCCGQAYLPTRLVEHLKKNSQVAGELIEMCPACRRKATAQNMVRAESLTGHKS